MVDIVLQQLLVYPTHAMFFDTSVINNLLIILPLHGHSIYQNANIHFSMVLMSKTSFRSWRPPRFGLFYHQAMHLLQMFGQQPFGTIGDNASANFTLPFQPNFCPFFVLRNQIKWTRGVCGWEAWSISNYGFKLFI
jgi:hypothetical protein